VDYLNYLGSIIRNDTRCTREIKFGIATAKVAFNKKIIFTSKLDLNLRKKLVKCYTWSITLSDAEAWTLRKIDQDYLESFKMRCWRMMENISWTDRVKIEEVFQRVKEERNVLGTIKKGKLTGLDTSCVGTAF
jgi:hypothetical protein